MMMDQDPPDDGVVNNRNLSYDGIEDGDLDVGAPSPRSRRGGGIPGDDDEKESDMEALLRHCMNERAAPELLHLQEDLVDRMMHNLEAQVRNRTATDESMCPCTSSFGQAAAGPTWHILPGSIRAKSRCPSSKETD